MLVILSPRYAVYSFPIMKAKPAAPVRFTAAVNLTLNLVSQESVIYLIWMSPSLDIYVLKNQSRKNIEVNIQHKTCRLKICLDEKKGRNGRAILLTGCSSMKPTGMLIKIGKINSFRTLEVNQMFETTGGDISQETNRLNLTKRR